MSMSPSIGALNVDNTLPNADSVMQLLKRVAESSEPILKKRGWKVKRLQEITQNLNKMSGVWGFCEPEGDGRTSSRIALVLRGSEGEVMSFVEVMGTMLHEIAHIAHGSHAGPFYRLMAELIEEWEVVVMKVPVGRLLDPEGNVMSENVPDNYRQCFGGLGKKLGGRNKNWKCLCQRDLAGCAAERRAFDSTRQKGYGATPSTKRPKHSMRGDCYDEQEALALVASLHASELHNGALFASELEDAISLSITEAASASSPITQKEQMELDYAIALSFSC